MFEYVVEAQAMEVTPVQSEWMEATLAAQVLAAISALPKEGTVVFLDIDDTLITPRSTTFRRPPYNKLMDEIKHHKHKYENYAEILSNWRLMRAIQLIDEEWPTILDGLQLDYPVFGLTKMDTGSFGNIPSMEEWRIEELASLGIHFGHRMDLTLETEDLANPPSFEGGIFFMGSATKAQVLASCWPVLAPKHVVLVDDRTSHLDDVRELCEALGAQFTGILFSGLSRLPGEPDPKIAACQKEVLISEARWLEDHEVDL